MHNILFGGAQNTGKSQAIYRTASTLQSKGFKVIAQEAYRLLLRTSR